MKKRIFLLLLAIFTFTYGYSQLYHEDDKEGLRKFLRQQDLHNSRVLGIVGADTLNWLESEEWVNKVAGLRWNDDSLKRIEYIYWRNKALIGSLDCSKFLRLQYFECNDNNLTEIDISENYGLISLYCYNNSLTSLDVTNNRGLVSLECYNNKITVINVSENEKLYYFYCHDNPLISLDVSKNIQLRHLTFHNTSISSIDLSNNINLKTLYCYNNKLTDLDVTNNVNLEFLSCHNNRLTSLDVSKNLNLKSLYCYKNSLANLDVLKNSKLEILSCFNTSISSLDVSKNINLRELYCYNNSLIGLDISDNVNLEILNWSNSGLSSLDVSKNSNLKELYCQENKLTHLDISNNVRLKTLYCHENLLSHLDISDNKNLEVLSCGNNDLIDLDVSKNDSLKKLYCYNNLLTNLDLMNNANLELLSCSDNDFLNLDVLRNFKLRALYCWNNKLSNLDVSNLVNLKRLQCYNNSLSELNVSNNPKLTEILCDDNDLTRLDLSNNKLLNKLSCSRNKLTFSTLTNLSDLEMESNTYSPQQKIIDSDIESGVVIDLSSEYKIGNSITDYKWYNQDMKEIALTSPVNGRFIVPKDLAGDSIYCRMTNATYPELTLEYVANVIGIKPIILKNHMKLNVKNNYQLEAGQRVQVLVETDAENPDDIELGLFLPTMNKLVYPLNKIAFKNNIYTCSLPQEVMDASYILAPYYFDSDNKPVMISRPENSHIIDRLPVLVESDIWGFRSLRNNESFNVKKYMQINIGGEVNKTLEVEMEIPFRVYIPTANPEETRVGLFLENGMFYKDITKSRKSYTYTCLIDDMSQAGNYIVMPYTEDNGTIEIVERSANDFYIMDRLPIEVLEGDIWGYSVNNNLKSSGVTDLDLSISGISIYPNPVQDILYVDSDSEIEKVSIYTMEGRLVQKTNYMGNKGIDVQHLSSGNYIILLESKERTSSMKFTKN